jgi:hypothetical protein
MIGTTERHESMRCNLRDCNRNVSGCIAVLDALASNLGYVVMPMYAAHAGILRAPVLLPPPARANEPASYANEGWAQFD